MTNHSNTDTHRFEAIDYGVLGRLILAQVCRRSNTLHADVLVFIFARHINNECRHSILRRGKIRLRRQNHRFGVLQILHRCIRRRVNNDYRCLILNYYTVGAFVTNVHYLSYLLRRPTCGSLIALSYQSLLRLIASFMSVFLAE